jgi:NAD(P)H-dependent FMN reductase
VTGEPPASNADLVRVLTLLGSATQPGRLHRALAEASERTGADVDAELLDLAEMKIALADGRPPETLGDDTADLLARLDAAHALIIATPVYRGSLTGTLKNALDQTPVAILRGKPIGLVAMGATDHHFLGAERHLRDILAFFGAFVAPVAVYLTSADFADGVPSESAATRLDALIETVIGLTRSVPRDVATRLAPFAR